MDRHGFSIELRKIHWLKNDGNDDQDDRCAHGKVKVTIGNEIVADNADDSNDWWSLTAMALHLLRTLDMNHTSEAPVGGCLVPGEGHHIDHLENDPMVHIETAYPMVEGKNWWVIHQAPNVKLVSESANETIIPFENYRNEVLNFVDQVEHFYKKSKPKLLPEDDYDKKGYLKLWNEWNSRRRKWK